MLKGRGGSEAEDAMDTNEGHCAGTRALSTLGALAESHAEPLAYGGRRKLVPREPVGVKDLTRPHNFGSVGIRKLGGREGHEDPAEFESTQRDWLLQKRQWPQVAAS
ncbi:hypothetical protein NSPZN2_40676 [Nitrospira defluvii]|uniref:Uncharacterized protein n=1 Tax=Nitrospira defluvii TaxID=330214 RepID=A0ABN7M2Q6_9BACT|nr:hypothetical protein NSPZN2_40676 [Nitrospira defluvii]